MSRIFVYSGSRFCLIQTLFFQLHTDLLGKYI